MTEFEVTKKDKKKMAYIILAISIIVLVTIWFTYIDHNTRVERRNNSKSKIFQNISEQSNMKEENNLSNIIDNLNKSFLKGNEEYKLAKKCLNNTLIEASHCILNQTNEKYRNFKETPDKYNYSLLNIMQKGGDCRNYAKLYQRIGEAYGIYSKTVVFSISSNDAHRITIWSNHEEYAIMTTFKMIGTSDFNTSKEVKNG